MTRLAFSPDLDPLAVSWTGPRQPAPETCSICETAVGSADLPLVLWLGDGWCARLCEACVDRWVIVVRDT